MPERNSLITSLALVAPGLWLALVVPASAKNMQRTPETAEAWAWSKIELGERADFNERCGAKVPLDPRTTDNKEREETELNNEKAWRHPCRELKASFIVNRLTKAPWRDRIPAKGLNIYGARIVGNIDLAHEKITRRISVNGSRIEGSIDLDAAQVSDEVEFVGSRIVGNFSSASRFHAEKGLFLSGSEFQRGVDLFYSKIDGPVLMDGSRLEGEMNAWAVRVEGDLFMSGRARFKGVFLRSASVAGNVEMDGSTFDDTLNADGLHVGGSLFMRNGAKFNSVILSGASVARQVFMDGSIYTGDLILNEADVGGSVDMDGSQFAGELDADKLRVGASLVMRDGTKFKNVVLHSANVAGQVSMNASTFEGVLHADAIHVGDSLFIRDCRFLDKVYLTFATIGQNLDLRGATLASLDLAGARIAGEFRLGSDEEGGRETGWRRSSGEPGNLILRNAKIGGLSDDKDTWPEKGHLSLEGFSFSHIGGFVGKKGSEARERGAEWWDEWARLDEVPFSPHPYQQLAAAFTLAGDKDLADDIRYNGRVREHETQSGLNWLWSAFLRWVAGFGIGNYPFRVLYWVGALSVAGALYLWKYAKGVRDKGHGFAWCWGASLTRLLPVIEINKEFTDFFNDPDRKNLTPRENAAFSAMGLVGWFLAAVLIAAVSGITGKS